MDGISWKCIAIQRCRWSVIGVGEDLEISPDKNFPTFPPGSSPKVVAQFIESRWDPGSRSSTTRKWTSSVIVFTNRGFHGRWPLILRLIPRCLLPKICRIFDAATKNCHHFGFSFSKRSIVSKLITFSPGGWLRKCISKLPFDCDDVICGRTNRSSNKVSLTWNVERYKPSVWKAYTVKLL